MVRITALAAVAALAVSLPAASSAELMHKRAPQHSSSTRHHRADATPSSDTASDRTTQRAASATSAAGAATTGLGVGGPGVAGVSAASSFTGSLPASQSRIVATISSGTPSSTPSVALPTTFSDGQVNSLIPGAPALPPSSGLVVSQFPTLDRTPDPNLPMSQQFLKSVDLTGVPDIPVTTNQASCASNPNNLAKKGADGYCWWTCGGCTRNTDVVSCPDRNTWGVSYDDGPSPYTPTLLKFMDDNKIKSTFFIVGSRAISRPDILRYEYMTGHQLSVHTWSHTSLTTQTNEQIVLELAWTKHAIQTVTGVTPNTMRPPYGDIDDRVRAISAKLGLTPIIWTRPAVDTSYDTNDWKISSGVVSAAQVVYNFDSIFANASKLNTGYIVLAHDLYFQAVELATQIVLPMAVMATNPKQSLKTIIDCQGQPLQDAYVETNRNLSNGASSPGGPTVGAAAAKASASNGVGTGAAPSTSGSTTTSGTASMLAAARSASPLLLALGALAFGGFAVL